jgi:phage tail-like protein
MSKTIVSAEASTTRSIRVVFSDAVDTTALVASAWTVAGTGTSPFATPEVSSVVGVDSAWGSGGTGTNVDLFLDMDLSPGKPYMITATGITDVGGSGGNTASFTVAALPVVPGRQFTLRGWIPQDDLRRDDTGDLRALVAVIDDQLALLVDSCDRWPDCQDPDLAAEQFVDQMLIDLGNPFEDALLTLAKKRLLVKHLIPLYKQRGTGPGLINAIWFFLGLNASLLVANRQGMRLGVSLLGLDWILGCGDNKWWFKLQVATPSGRAFTDYETRVLTQIIKFMRCAQDQIVLQAVLVAPTGIAAVPYGPSSPGISVSWSGVTGATSFNLYMASVPGVTPRNGQCLPTIVPGLILSMPAGYRRYFVVTAVNAQGEGLASTEISAVSG